MSNIKIKIETENKILYLFLGMYEFSSDFKLKSRKAVIIKP